MTTEEGYRTALELIGYREMCHTSEAEELRKIARDALGWNDDDPQRTFIRDRLNGEKGTPDV